MVYRYNVFIACDSVYHEQWARNLAQSIQHYNPWIRVVMLVINPRDIVELPDVEYHYREVDLSGCDAVAYYQAARFVHAADIFQDHDLVLCLDADTVCTRAITRSQFWRLTRRPGVLWHDKSQRWLAGLVSLGRGLEFAKALQSAMCQISPQQWPANTKGRSGYDQAILAQVATQLDVDKVRNTGRWISIGKGPGVFLTLKGEQKNSGAYLRGYQQQLRHTVPPQEPPDHLPRVTATALVGPWLQGLPLPNLTTVREISMDQLGADHDTDVWIIHNNTENKRTKRYRAEYQLLSEQQRPLIVVESPVFRYNQARPDSDNVYYRWSWFSYFRDRGIHYHDNSPPDRWQQIQQDQRIQVHDWNSRGDNILFLLQRPGDSSLEPMIQRWGSYANMVMQKISAMRRLTDRPIRLRLHPLRHDQQMEYLRPIMNYFSDVEISQHSETSKDSWVSGGDSLYRDFDQAWCVVGGNSNGLVESVCYGLPTWCFDESAMAWPVSQGSLRRINNPRLDVDRQQWLNNLGYCQWRRDEIIQGLPWFHLLQWWPDVQGRVK